MNQSPQLNDSEKWAYVVARWHNEATQKLLDWAGLIERSYLAAPNPGDFLKGMAPKTIPGWAAGYLNDLESLADEIKKRATWGTPEYEKDSLPAKSDATNPYKARFQEAMEHATENLDKSERAWFEIGRILERSSAFDSSSAPQLSQELGRRAKEVEIPAEWFADLDRLYELAAVTPGSPGRENRAELKRAIEDLGDRIDTLINATAPAVKKGRVGRPRRNNPMEDAKIAGQFEQFKDNGGRTYKEFLDARNIQMSIEQLKRLLDRHRHRKS